MRKLVLFLFAVGLIATAGASVLVFAEYRKLLEPLPVAGPVDFTIPSGASMASVASDLEERGLIARADTLNWYARYAGLAQSIQAGEYRLEPGLSAVDALNQFTKGAVLLHSVTFVEGWTTARALAELQAHPAISVTLNPDDESAVLQSVGAEESHPEGLFFPSTYRFARGTSDVEILRQAYRFMRNELNNAWADRVPELPLESAYEALILASIIEKETARDDERRQIAGVFARRLKKNMRLQTDPTVIYGMGAKFDGNIRKRDLKSDTPYNTYTRAGLPPTPIALAGAASIRAAVDPAPGKTLFFVATGDGDGSHYFSATAAEHQTAVLRYLKNLRARRSQ